MALNWMEKTNKKWAKRENRMASGYEILTKLFKKYDTSLAELKTVSNWRKVDQKRFISGMKKIGYKEDLIHRFFTV